MGEVLSSEIEERQKKSGARLSQHASEPAREYVISSPQAGGMSFGVVRPEDNAWLGVLKGSLRLKSYYQCPKGDVSAPGSEKNW